MKKKSLVFIILVLVTFLVINQISALDISLSKSSYQPGETLQAQITGNFISLSLNNIAIYKQGIPRETPVISDFTKQGDIYYFYAILPYTEGNYTLKIQNAKYISAGQTGSDDITKDFTILKTNESYLSINPGFVITNKDFSVKIKSLNGNSQLTASLDSQSQKVSIIEDTEKSLDFSVPASNTNLLINSYSIPVFVTQASVNPITQSSDLIFTPSTLSATVSSGNNYFFNIIVKNIGNKNLTDIVLSSDLNAIINPTNFSLDINEISQINVTIPIPSSQNNISGKLTASFNDKTQVLPIFLQITNNQSEINLNGTSTTQTLSCSELGKVCNIDEQCSGDTTASLDGPCCIGDCNKVSSSGSSSVWYGIVLFIILIGIIVYFYFKIKKKQKPKSTDEMLEEKSNRFKKRMSPEEQKPSKEVSDSLGRV